MDNWEPNIFSKSFSIWQASYDCWKCHKATKVYAIGITNSNQLENSEQLSNDGFLTNISHFSKEVLEKLIPISKTYFLDKSGMADEIYYINHCEHCGAKQGDFFLHMEPDGPFWGDGEGMIFASHQIPLQARSFL